MLLNTELPSLHVLLHLPEYMGQRGPLHQCWQMQFHQRVLYGTFAKADTCAGHLAQDCALLLPAQLHAARDCAGNLEQILLLRTYKSSNYTQVAPRSFLPLQRPAVK